MNSKLRLLSAIAALLWLTLASPVHAQSYPSRSVTLVATGTPGSATDVLARLIADRLTGRLGQQLLVLNRPGASGNIAADVVAKAAPDGYTLLLGSVQHTVNQHLFKSLPYKLSDFAPVSSVAAAPDILVVHPSVPVKSVAELVAMLKAKPGTLAGHAGVGTLPHLSLEMFRRMAGVEIAFVPFKTGGGAGGLMQGVVSGQVPFVFGTTFGMLAAVRNGQVRALAVSSAKRIAATPELPTVAESGFPGFESVAWFGILAPANTPKSIIDQLSAEVIAALASPALRQRLIDLGAEPLGSSPEEFATFVKADDERWRKLIGEIGIRLE